MARLHRDSTLSSLFIDPVPTECQTLQMIWIEYGQNKRRFTDPRTLCIVLLQVEMALMTRNQHTNTLKSTAGVTLTSMYKINNHPWKWLARTLSISLRDRGLMKMPKKPSTKWSNLPAKPGSRMTSSDNSTLHPKWVRDLLLRVNFPNSLLKERKRLMMQLQKDSRKCLGDLHSKIN